MQLILSMLTVVCSGSFIYAQMVESTTYNLMLKTLLSHNVPEVGVAEAHKDTLAVFIDAREIKEFQVSHIKNAVWCGYDDFDLKRVEHIPKNQKIIVYCSVGYRSEKISEKLISAGYDNISNMYGGIFEWKNRDYPLVDERGKVTDKIHAYSRTWGIWVNKGEKVYD